MNDSIGEPATPTNDAVAYETSRRKQATNNISVKIVRDVRLLLIAIWLGSSVFFSVAIAPSVFSILPSRELAGAVVSRTLGIINAGGFIIGLVLIASAFLFRSVISKRAFFFEIVSLVLFVISNFVGKWVIAAQMHALRGSMARPIDEVAQSDPLRIAFNNLHGYSVTALSIGMLVAIICLLLIARRTGN